MADILKSLKEKFPDIYALLLKNQNEKGLIFFGPNKLMYSKDSLNEQSFYYNHIFKKSEFDPNLYTNFYGKVLKSIKEKSFVTYIGWKEKMTINVIEQNTNEDGLFFFQTDGTCIEELSKAAVYSDKKSLPLKHCKTSSEYINYYSQFNNEENKGFQRLLNSIESFLFTINNNFLLVKGFEKEFSKILLDKINKFVSAFEIIFRDKSSISKEYIDSYIITKIHDKIMEKFDSFYFEEKNELKTKIDENIYKFGIIELNLDNSLLKCDFEETFNIIRNLKNYKTIFEKIRCLKEINDSMLNEVKTKYEEENDQKLDIQGDLLSNCWSHLMANYIKKYDAKDIFNEYLFFNFFQINSRNEDNYIITTVIVSIGMIENELLNRNNRQKIELLKVSSFD